MSEILGDRYSVQQQLGKKAGRRTVLARDLETQELVVIKLLSFSSDFEWDDLKLFEREAQTLKNLAHESIPRYLDYFEINSPLQKGFALVQTYIPAQTLEQYLSLGRTFTEAEVKQIAKAVLEILIYLHQQNPPVIHRDIKPSNILLGDKSGNSVGQVYLIDFGSVQTVAAREGGTITVVGTYGYMPQEQFGGRTVPASDLYSLGATLIYLITGVHPADLPQKDFRIQFEQLTNLSHGFTDWLRWMCEPSLDRRLGSAKLALEVLEQPQQRDIPMAVSKPVNSKVSLTKNADSLEILIPPVGLYSKTGFRFFITLLYCFTVPILTFYFLLTFDPFWLSSSLWFQALVYLILFSVLNALTSAISLLYASFARVQLCITRQKFLLNNQGFFYKIPFRGLTQAIVKLEYVKPSTKNRRGSLKSRIIVWVGGTQNFQLGSIGHITQADLDWLAYELSEWLGMPITQE